MQPEAPVRQLMKMRRQVKTRPTMKKIDTSRPARSCKCHDATRERLANQSGAGEKEEPASSEEGSGKGEKVEDERDAYTLDS